MQEKEEGPVLPLDDEIEKIPEDLSNFIFLVVPDSVRNDEEQMDLVEDLIEKAEEYGLNIITNEVVAENIKEGQEKALIDRLVKETKSTLMIFTPEIVKDEMIMTIFRAANDWSDRKIVPVLFDKGVEINDRSIQSTIRLIYPLLLEQEDLGKYPPGVLAPVPRYFQRLVDRDK